VLHVRLVFSKGSKLGVFFPRGGNFQAEIFVLNGTRCVCQPWAPFFCHSVRRFSLSGWSLTVAYINNYSSLKIPTWGRFNWCCD